ncbi:MAG: alpha-galactosidase [Clostridia bacterium]|nr:alpha-galactosidase [Clostridia bacterium]
MKIENCFKTNNIDGIAGLFSVSGDFGVIDGLNTGYKVAKTDNSVCYTLTTNSVELKAEFVYQNDGLVLRKDTFKNLSNEPVTVYRLFSRFAFEGGEYDVYTQTNGWQRECKGRWQTLSTQVVASSLGVRTCDSASPIMALKNKQNGRITVMHLFPNCQWNMSARRRFFPGTRDYITVETGIEPSGLALKVDAGETIYLPEVLFLQTEDALSLGCDLVHKYFLQNYPQREVPVIYNTWLLNFDHINYENIVRQAETAAGLGMEYFVVDAGWFGQDGKPWSECVGDWVENTAGAFKGRLKELGDYVRSLGMKFGLWFEPERAFPESNANKNNPGEFVGDRLTDFASDKARERVFNDICSAIDKYDLKYVKFDFNWTIAEDPTHSGFYRYMQGNFKFIKDLKEKYPDLYLTNCASGGMRMELEQSKLYDSFWLSDNQGPYDGIRIVRDYLKRLPSCKIERWNVQTAIQGVPNLYKDEKLELMMSCNNATWEFLIGVDPTFNLAFLTGGPLGYSCDIASFPTWYKEKTKEFIKLYKENRNFFAVACAKMLCETESITVIEYYSSNYDRAIIQFFAKCVDQDELTVYPSLDSGATYLLNGEEVLANDLIEDGYTFKDIKDNYAYVLDLKKV